jgi:Flp pilus assembly protein TadG
MFNVWAARAHNDRSPARRERGAAAVEFALVLPILLFIIFGIVAYGFVFAGQITINSAARDAARAGVVQPLNGSGMTCQAIASRARSASTTIGLNPSNVTVKVSSPSAPGAPVCTLPPNNVLTGSPGTTKMCTGSVSGGQLVVRISYAPKAPVPLIPMPSSLAGNGSFQCEYS